jgi:hypothetical protein
MMQDGWVAAGVARQLLMDGWNVLFKESDMKTLMNVVSASLVAGAMAFALTGCETTPMSAQVPTGATQVAAATGTTTYRTSDAGKIYIYDKTWNKLVYSGDVLPNQNVQVDTEHSRVLVDEKPVVDQVSLGSGDQYQFYLDTSATTSTTVEKRTVVEREIHD